MSKNRQERAIRAAANLSQSEELKNKFGSSGS